MDKNIIINSLKNTENHSLLDVCRELCVKPNGYYYDLFRKIIKDENIDISHLRKTPWNKGLYYRVEVKPLSEILTKDSKIQSAQLKRRLFNNGLKEHKCECCGNTEWMGLPIKLELHHINGDHFDNRLENLQILCPNCHSMTDNYRGKNSSLCYIPIKKCVPLTKEEITQRLEEKKEQKRLRNGYKPRKKQEIYERICPTCGKTFTTKRKEQKYCSLKCSSTRDSKLPSKETLLKDIDELGYNFSKIGRKYEISPNGVKKWFKKYDIYIKYKYHQDLHNSKIEREYYKNSQIEN
ncbi:MAG: HNH endonuclease [bacterium]|nr:HNH endonuclease [bacterium]